MNHSAVRSNYNRLSRFYDLFSSSEKQFTDLCLQMLNVGVGEKVLDVGFGTGHALVTMACSVGENGRVYGIDLSAGMYQVAKVKISRAGLSNRIDLRIGDAVNLPFEDNFLDAVFIGFTLELFDTPEIPLVLGECKRVLRNDGRLGVVALEKKDCRSVKIYDWFHTRIPSIVDCRPIPLREIIETAGFEPVESREKTIWGLPVMMVIARRHG
jgi:demethylmenaquinone methyltransferase/2-methoxy-6-polyprenyl-1,4-benzoquinol methylase